MLFFEIEVLFLFDIYLFFIAQLSFIEQIHLLNKFIEENLRRIVSVVTLPTKLV